MPNKQETPTKVGWRITPWSAAVGCQRSFTNKLIKERKVQSVRLGGMRIIVTPPREFLESLIDQQADRAA